MHTQFNGNTSIAKVTDDWYVLCESRELRDRPLARQLMGVPLVLFRADDGRPGALLDRCAHRNVPLSAGRITSTLLQCAYHGWQYDRSGTCRRIPGLAASAERPTRAVPSYATREQDGYVWVYATADVEPKTEPFSSSVPAKPGYTTVRRVVEADATLHAVIENALDVPHTSFVHKDLFRGTGRTHAITAIVTRSARSVQTEYVGEPRPQGLAARVLSPTGGVVTHYDRFILPSIAQVEYSIGNESHILITAICTPVEEFFTRLYASVSFRSRVPGWLAKPVLNPIAMRIFKQDKRILELQTRAAQRFGGTSYVSTELDLMGTQITRLLRLAEQGKLSEDGEEWRRETRLEV